MSALFLRLSFYFGLFCLLGSFSESTSRSLIFFAIRLTLKGLNLNNMLKLLGKFRTEEKLFGMLAVYTILTRYQFAGYSIFTSLILSFYYIVFGWYLLNTKNEKHIWFSLFSGLVYAVCFVVLAIYSGKLLKDPIFYFISLIVLFPLTIFLFFKKDWGDYKKLHFARILAILFLNIFVYLSDNLF